MNKEITARDIVRFFDIICEVDEDNYYNSLKVNITDDGDIMVLDSKNKTYKYSEMIDSIKECSEGELFTKLSLMDFIWDVDEFENGGHIIKVKKGSEVVRKYYRDWNIHVYDINMEKIAYSDISLTTAYMNKLIIER